METEITEDVLSVKFELTTTTMSRQGEIHTSHVEKATPDTATMLEYLKGVIADAESED